MKIASLILILLIASCGKPGSSPKSLSSLDPLQESKNIIAEDGTYVAVLHPINGEAVGFSSGAVTINIRGDEMVSNVRFNGSAPATLHSQSIHASGFCPGEIADENSDGYVDVLESLPYTSDVLIPLDSDLNSQAAGIGFYPVADGWGTYIYSVVNSYHTLMSDLHAPDEDVYDGVVKLLPGAPLHLEERVVVIYGTAESDSLPESVGSISGLSANQTIPIACGHFTKVTKLPGTPLPDETVPTPSSPERNRPGNGTSSRNPHRGNNSGSSNRPQTNDHQTQTPMCRSYKACIMNLR